MALSFSLVRYGVEDMKKWVECDVTFDSSYPTGGEAVSPDALGLDEIRRISVVYEVYPDKRTSARTNHGQQVVPVLTDPLAPKLRVYTSANTEASNASDQSGIVERIRFIGS